MILHIARGEAWRAALIAGVYESPPFIHCSTGRQVRIPWRIMFATTEDLVLLLIDEHVIDAPVHYETAIAGEEAFPHVYGSLPVDAVVSAEPIAPHMATALALPPRITHLLAAARGDSPPGVDEWHHLEYTVSTNRSLIDMDCVHGFLSRDAYWSTGIPRDVMEMALGNSLCFGLSSPSGDQAGFCRVVTDHATYGYLADVFVLPEHRGL